MRTHTYRAATVQDAIRLAKAELGPDALIVDVRRAGGFAPGGGREGYVEISAMAGDTNDFQPAVDVDAFPPIDEIATRARRAPRRITRRQTTPVAPLPRAVVPAYDDEAIEQDIDFICDLGIAAPLASEIAEACSIGSAMSRHAAVARTLERAIPTRDLGWTGPGRVIAALIGPSGVGKTTTVAKLAAAFSAGQRHRVALITTDTYRVGAIAQLRTFAEILQLPFYTVYSREDLDAALRETGDRDLVLIDTPGCNPYDSAMLKEMRGLLGPRTPIACYLTLAMNADFEEMVSAARRFALLNPTGLIATKLDETRRSARLIGLAHALRLPLNYVCAGPLVPEDIALATPAMLADLLLEALEPRYPRELV